MPTSIKWYQSKIVWLNIITTVAAFLDMINSTVPAKIAPYILAGVGLCNIILRIWFSTSAISKP